MPKVSITLPSLRPDLLSDCVRVLHASAGFDDFEIIVVSPFEAAGPRLRWIPEAEPAGNCRAHALAYTHATGDIIVALTDYVWPRSNWLVNLVRFIERMEARHFPFCAGQFWVNATKFGPMLGTLFGRHYAYYPAASRRSLEAVGGWYSPEFMTGYGDCDLGLRMWEAGGQVRPCWDSVIMSSYRRDTIPTGKQGLKHRILEDKSIFEEKWGSKLGNGWMLGDDANYSIDIPVAMIPFDDMIHLRSVAECLRDGRQPHFRIQ